MEISTIHIVNKMVAFVIAQTYLVYFMQMARLNDTLRELGSRVVQARQQGEKAAELKKSGEISVLQKELGSKSRYACVNINFWSIYLNFVGKIVDA